MRLLATISYLSIDLGYPEMSNSNKAKASVILRFLYLGKNDKLSVFDDLTSNSELEL